MDKPTYNQLDLSCFVSPQTLVLSKILQEKPQGRALVGDLSKLLVVGIMPLICVVWIRELSRR